MEAVFCDYDRGHHGTLLPLSATKGWQIRRAEQLLTPHLATTYVEGVAQKGVLVVQRQRLNGGEVENGLPAEVDLSVYVFRFDGTRWVFEKGNKSAVRTGRHGFAQPCGLVRLGSSGFGLLVPGASGNRGYWFFHVAVVPLSSGPVREAGVFKMGENNSGTCGTSSGTDFGPCYESKGTLEFLDDGGAGHWLLRHRISGTGAKDSQGPVTPVNSTTCHRLGAAGYTEVQAGGCDQPESVRARVTYTGLDLIVEELPPARAKVQP
jgi:hypothetical protein